MKGRVLTVDVRNVKSDWVLQLWLSMHQGEFARKAVAGSLTESRGEVTHLHCKDGFSAKLAKVRS